MNRIHDEKRKKRWLEDKTAAIKTLCDHKASCDLSSIRFPPHDFLKIDYACYNYDPVEFCEKHLVQTNTESLTPCKRSSRRHHRRRHHRRGLEDVVDHTLSGMDTMLDLSRFQPNSVVTQHVWNATNPIIEHVEERFNGVRLPLSITCDIRNSHIRNRPRPAIPTYVHTFLRQQMNSAPNDDAGHLLAHSLGGPTNEIFNFIPMTIQANRGQNSLWRRFEIAIPGHLRDNPQGCAIWRIMVIYERGLGHFITNTRPLGLCLDYSLYTDANNQVNGQSPGTLCISNDSSDRVCTLQLNPHA